MRLSSAVLFLLPALSLATRRDSLPHSSSSTPASSSSSSTDNEFRTFIPGDSPIDTCTSPAPETDLIVIDHLEISPNPPQRGQNLTITASGTVKEDISDGAYVEIEVKYGLIRLIRQTLDLCEQTAKVDLPCPIEEGVVTLQREVQLPQAIPPGKYSVNAKVFTKDDREVTCLVARVV